MGILETREASLHPRFFSSRMQTGVLVSYSARMQRGLLSQFHSCCFLPHYEGTGGIETTGVELRQQTPLASFKLKRVLIREASLHPRFSASEKRGCSLGLS